MGDQHKRPQMRLAIDDDERAHVQFSPHDVVIVGRHALPRALRVTLPAASGLPTLVVDVETDDDGRSRCTHVTLDSDSARGIRAADVTALPIDDLTADAVAVASASLIVGDGDGIVIDGRDETADERGKRGESVRAAVRAMRAADSSRIDADRIAAAADTFRRHEDSGRPLVHVMHEHGLSRRTAARWIERARLDGLLPPSARSAAQPRNRATIVDRWYKPLPGGGSVKVPSARHGSGKRWSVVTPNGATYGSYARRAEAVAARNALNEHTRGDQ